MITFKRSVANSHDIDINDMKELRSSQIAFSSINTKMLSYHWITNINISCLHDYLAFIPGKIVFVLNQASGYQGWGEYQIYEYKYE